MSQLVAFSAIMASTFGRWTPAEAERTPFTRAGINFSARHIVDTTAPYELVSKMRAIVLGHRPAAGPHGRGAASRCPAAAPLARGRSTCSSTACRRWVRQSTSRAATSSPRQRPPQGRPICLPQGLGRRDPCADDGGIAGEGRNRVGQRRARTEIVDLADCLNAMGAKIKAPAPRPSPSTASTNFVAPACASFPTASKPAPMRWRWR